MVAAAPAVVVVPVAAVPQLVQAAAVLAAVAEAEAVGAAVAVQALAQVKAARVHLVVADAVPRSMEAVRAVATRAVAFVETEIVENAETVAIVARIVVISIAEEA